MRPASKLSFPVSELFLDQGTLQPLALPGGVVGVLNWQFGQRDRVPMAERVVKRCQLTEKHAQRPGISNDMVDVHQQHVLRLAESHQNRPDQPIHR